MKKLCLLGILVLLLAGCGGPKSYETISDVYVQPELPQPGDVAVLLPADASVMTMTEDRTGSIYLCDGYSIEMQVLESGDLNATLRTATGFSREQLSLMERSDGKTMRYECVWAAAGEGADQVGRAVILDDGNYHYVLTVMADADRAGQLRQTWEELLRSFSLNTAP